MNNSRVKAMLFLTICVMTVLPLTAAFYLLDHALKTSLDLGFNPSVVQALNAGSQNLKALKRLDPRQQDLYREQFEAVERLKRVYSNPQPVKVGILDSLRIYFALGVLAAVLLSVLVAAILSHRIARSYAATFHELIHHKERVRYLEEMASWQELARMLAHEIKNPLTPIEVLVTSLSKAYLSKSEQEFSEQLSETQAMIAEELQHLKNTVSKFSEFARLPAVRLLDEDLPALIAQIANTLASSFDAADIRILGPGPSTTLRARVDATLFRQVLTNIVRNGIEANPGRRIQFGILIAPAASSISICVFNDGPPVPAEIAASIFDPYVSGKSGKDNMGLGLAIVKKIILEHGGEVAYHEKSGRPAFTISLPRAG